MSSICQSEKSHVDLNTNKPRVRFNETNEEFIGTALDHAQAAKFDIWYQQSDMKQMKEGAFMLARQAGKYGVGSLLGNTYGKDDQPSIDSVQAWAIACGERRGLERFHCRHYAKKRMEIRRKTILSVLKAQYRMHVTEELTDRDYTAVVIGRLSETFSMDSRRFARVLGEADAVVVHSIQAEPAPVSAPVDKKPKLVQRQKTPQSVMMLNQWTEDSELSPHVSTSFSKTVSRPASSAATAFLSYY